MKSSTPTAVPVLGLFALALVVRWLFLSASPDGLGPFSPYYKGDAPLWLAYASALQQGQPFGLELGLPLRPPGNAWLVDWLWDGTVEGLPSLRGAYAFLGACAVPLTFVVASAVGRSVALVASAWVAVSFGAIQLSASPNVEAPYMLLALATVWAAQRLRGGATWWWGIGFGSLLGLGSLFRAEHALLGIGLLVWALRGVFGLRGAGGVIRSSAAALGVAIIVLAPWHVAAFGRVAAFNRAESPLRAARTLPWTEDAVAALDALPGFARADAQRFVEDTVKHRGGGAVSVDQIEVLDQAFGWRPEPLPEFFFVALYGPLNFFLGQTGGPGFRRDALQALPVLQGGRDTYPAAWLASLPPPGGLSLGYPQHLRPVLHGYADGLDVLFEDLSAGLEMTVAKIWRGLRGATSGVGGFDFPAMGPFVRARVDQAVSSGMAAGLWSCALLALSVFGLWRGRDRLQRLMPLLWWGVSTLVVLAAFFGYARLGALLIPLVGVCLGLAVEPLAIRNPRLMSRLGLGLLVAVLAAECVRWSRGVTLAVDGAHVGTVEPWPPLEFEDRQLEVRVGTQDD